MSDLELQNSSLSAAQVVRTDSGGGFIVDWQPFERCISRWAWCTWRTITFTVFEEDGSIIPQSGTQFEDEWQGFHYRKQIFEDGTRLEVPPVPLFDPPDQLVTSRWYSPFLQTRRDRSRVVLASTDDWLRFYGCVSGTNPRNLLWQLRGVYYWLPTDAGT